MRNALNEHKTKNVFGVLIHSLDAMCMLEVYRKVHFRIFMLIREHV